MSVTVRAKLPAGDTNGLTHLEGTLAADPDAALLVIGVLRADTIESRPHNDKDSRLVKTVLLHVEAIDGSDRDQAEKLMRSIYEARTGKSALPFEEQGDAD